MKKLPFLIFVAIITIAVSACIVLGYKIEVMVGFIVGFVFNLAVAIQATDEKAQKRKLICKDDYKETSVGEILGIAVGIGACLALFGGFVFGSPIGALFLFLGSILGAVVGLMYKH